MEPLILFVLSCLLLFFLWSFPAKSKSGSHSVRGEQNGKEKQLPCPPVVGFWKAVGDAIRLRGQIHLALIKWYKELGPIYSIHIGKHRIIMLNTAEIIQKMFNEVPASGRPMEPYMAHHAAGKHGVVIADGPGWVEQRRFMIKTLKDLGVEKIYMEKFLRGEAEEFVENLRSLQGKPVPMNKRFYLPVLNSLWMILTGIRYDHEDTKLFKLATHVYQAVDLVGRMPYLIIHIWPWIPYVAQYFLALARDTLHQFVLLHQFLRKIITERQAEFVSDNDSQTREDFLNTYLQEIQRTTNVNSTFHGQKGITSLIAVMSDFFIAGVETTATSLVWAALHLARNSDCQKKIQAELDHVVGTGRLPIIADRPNCPYTEAVINEILRITPVATVSVPHAAMEDFTFDGYFIPKGSWILPAIGTVHRDVNVWGDPENFRPERFLTEVDGKKSCVTHPSLIPFSLGRRKCIGEKIARDNLFLFVTALCQTYDFVPDPKKPFPTLAVDSFLAFTPKPFACVFTERKMSQGANNFNEQDTAEAL